MALNFLAISIGNTRTQLGTFAQGKLARSEAVVNREIDTALVPALQRGIEPLEGETQTLVLMSSVDQHMSPRVVTLVEQTLGVKPLRVERDMHVPIGRQLDPESIVGEDRLLNAAAAYNTVKQACVIVDAGTAVTVDLVDGEAIAPGARMMLHALHQGADQLPEVEMRRPVEPIGHNTTEAMRSAVFYGIRGMVRELAEKYAESIGMFPLIIATGGDATMLFEGDELIERIVPDLTLMGMAVTLQSHMDSES